MFGENLTFQKPPRLTIERSKAMAATLAPFARSEKPQLSPRHAASFSKKARSISAFQKKLRTGEIGKTTPGGAVVLLFAPVSVDLPQRMGAARRPRARKKSDRVQAEQLCSTLRQG
jgi:hypothetical protein